MKTKCSSCLFITVSAVICCFVFLLYFMAHNRPRWWT